MFAPRSIAVVGATDREGSVGCSILKNLRAFPGKVFPINPRRTEVLGIAAFKSLRDVGQSIDLAIVVTPAPTVPALIRECVATGVKAVVIISAGFKETGSAGVQLEREILEAAHLNGLRIIGPNCLGIMAPHVGLNATFATAMANPGRVTFLSQSGALCTAILDWSFAQHVGFSAFVSVGSMLDVGWGDLIRHFGDDEHTSSIVIYMESVGDAESFMAAARSVALKKPIVVIKAGRTTEAARAAASHTGAMTGSDAVLDTAFRRAGVLRVDHIEELFDIAEVLSKQPLPLGPRLAIITNAGGPGALATDAAVRAGGQLATLSKATLAALDAALPAHWSHGNPIDVLGDADAARFGAAFQAVANDPGVDGILAVLTPQAMTEPLPIARALIDATKGLNKPVLASWMGDCAVAEARAAMNLAGLPTYDYPDEAARAFQFMWQRHERLKLLRETNRLADEHSNVITELREKLLAHIDLTPRLLTEVEAKQLLQLAGIPVVETRACRTLDEAITAADSLGYPVVLKLLSSTITHKTDVGGVQLNLINADKVREAWQLIRDAVPAADFGGVSVQRMIKQRGIELIVGSSIDSQFGPVLLFGAGGTMVEVFQDRALALPPLSPMLAEDWIKQTHIHRALKGVRGQPQANMSALLDVLVKLGNLVLALPEISELDINPLLATPTEVLALDARVVLNK
jgi:acetyltransferase